MILAWLKIILAIILLWPRGYLLVYVIDRLKNFSFGFKFFVSFVFGIAAFGLDIFGANVFGGFKLAPALFLASAVGQAISLEILIFFLERKFVYPKPKKLVGFLKKQWQNFSLWPIWEKLILMILILILVVRLAGSIWTVVNIPTYDFDAWNNWNLRAKVIFTESKIPLDQNSPFYLGGGIGSYPLNDTLFKVWLLTASGSFQESYINFASVIYYLLLLGIFYFSFSNKTPRLLKLLGLYLLSGLPLLYFHSHVAYADLLFSIFLFLTVANLFYWLAGRGNSFFYLSGIALAFSIWTKNEGLAIILPLIFLTTIVFLVLKKCNFKQLFFYWFWAAVTISPWLTFRITNRLNILSGDSSTFKLVFNYQFINELISSVFLRSHFNLLWLLVLIIIIFQIKLIWRRMSLRYLTLTLVSLFLIYNGIILFTDKAFDLSALARINMQLAPLGVLFLIFFLRQFFAKINNNK